MAKSSDFQIRSTENGIDIRHNGRLLDANAYGDLVIAAKALKCVDDGLNIAAQSTFEEWVRLGSDRWVREQVIRIWGSIYPEPTPDSAFAKVAMDRMNFTDGGYTGTNLKLIAAEPDSVTPQLGETWFYTTKADPVALRNGDITRLTDQVVTFNQQISHLRDAVKFIEKAD